MPDRRQLAMTLPHITSRRSKTALRERCEVQSAKPNASVHSFDSAQSEPPTPTWSLRGHARHPSSNSSVASSPQNGDCGELSSSYARLSKLAEEPPEPEDDCIIVEGDDTPLWQCLCDSQPCAHTASDDQHAVSPPKSPVFNFSDSFFGDLSGMTSRSSSTKHRPDDSPVDNIAQRLTNRFPSLSMRWKQRKPNLSLGTGYSTPSRAASSRSSSLSSTAVPALDYHDPLFDPFAPSPIEAVSNAQSPVLVEIPMPEEPIDRDALASTPLLPPMIDEARPNETPVQSPLQSPTVAESTSSFSMRNSPVGTPQVQAIKTPPLSTKPSIASFRHARAGHMVPSSEIPPIMIADPNDPWAIKLGHANFTIAPEPYVPEDFTAETIGALFGDWERARHNFTKHQVRTGEHFGVTSKTYLLTDEKWAEIDAQWKKNYDFTVAQASRQGSEVLPITPDEPAPLMKIPSLNDPKSEGKFPKLGDEDIVGPMVQFAAQIQPKPSRTANFLKLFSGLNLKIPSAPPSRSRTAFQMER